MKKYVCSLFTLLLAANPLLADNALVLMEKGVKCRVGTAGELLLGIPALDGRNTHLAPLPESVKTDGKTLTANFGAPFEGVTLAMRILDGNKVEYIYDKLPPDLKIVMTQFSLTQEMAEQGVSATFDGWKTVKIPEKPGKTNDDVRLANINANKVELKWTTGENLALTVPHKCWFGIQDQRIWGKKTIGICLTPPLKRNVEGGEKSTFMLAFATDGP